MQKNRLRDLVTKEISLVPRGANQGADVLVRKMDEETPMSFKQRITKALDDLKALVTKTDLEEVPGDEAPPADDPNTPAKEAPMTDTEKQELVAKIAELEKKLGTVEKAENEKVAKAEADAKAAQEQVAKMEAEREVTVAKAMLGQAPGKAEELAAVLKQLDDTGKAFVTTVLKQHNALLGASEVLKELGAGGDKAVETANEKVEKAAAEIRKADTSLTLEQARAEALRRNPGLYEELLSRTTPVA